MAAQQSSLDNRTMPFVIGGCPFAKDNETLLTDAARTVVLAQYTLMAQIAATRKWVPWLNANLGATDGKQYPLGILINDGGVAAADLAAGDVTGAVIVVGGDGLQIDSSQLVFDKGSTGAGTANTLNDIPTVPTNLAQTAERILNSLGIFPTSTIEASKTEN